MSGARRSPALASQPAAGPLETSRRQPSGYGRDREARHPRATLLKAAFIAALFAATVAAFVLAERLKLEPAPIRSTLISAPDQSRRQTAAILHAISPVCGCPTRAALLRFVLRRSDRVTVAILDSQGHAIRTLAQDKPAAHGTAQRYLWDGRTQHGAIAADGVYRFRVHLDDQHTTITLPNLLSVDTRSPRITVITARILHVTPPHRSRHYRLQIRYAVTEPAHAFLIINGRRVVLTRFERQTDDLKWGLTLSAKNAHLHRLITAELGAEDTAGNQTPKQQRVLLRISIRHRATTTLTRITIHTPPTN